MLKKVSNIPFKGTKEQEEKLKKVIDDNKHDKSLLDVRYAAGTGDIRLSSV